MDFEIVGEIEGAETIAAGSGIRIVSILTKRYGKGRWRKRKGVASIRLADGTMRTAELHWFEGHGIGKKKCVSSDSWIEDS